MGMRDLPDMYTQSPNTICLSIHIRYMLHVTNFMQHFHCHCNKTSRLNATSNCYTYLWGGSERNSQKLLYLKEVYIDKELSYHWDEDNSHDPFLYPCYIEYIIFLTLGKPIELKR